MRRFAPLLAALGWLGALACEAPAPGSQPSQGSSRADSVGIALNAFDAAVFDTIEWESDEAATERGGLVYRISCAKCHGNNGAGDGGFMMGGDTLRPPSFLAQEWALAQAPMRLRQYIFSGNIAGMPYWGLVGLKYRDIDAVARFLEGPLRAGIGQE